MTKFLRSLLVLLLTLGANQGFAHQQKAAETTIMFNQRSGHLEVMHRFYLHDTEHAVQKLFNKKGEKDADILKSEKTQKQFAQYVAKQFLAKHLDGRTIALNNVGFEVEGKFFWVYQDSPLPILAKGIKLYNGALRDLWPTQINMVNIERQGKVRTLYFSDDKDWLIAEFQTNSK